MTESNIFELKDPPHKQDLLTKLLRNGAQRLAEVVTEVRFRDGVKVRSDERIAA